MNSFRDRIAARVDEFVTELIEAIATEMLASFKGDPQLKTPKRNGKAPSKASKPSKPRGSRPKGAKRDPKELAALVDRLAAHIAGSPGQRIEEIGKAMSVPTKDLVLPIKKLLTAKQIRSTGTRRATRYFPESGASSTKKAPAKTKTATKKTATKKR